VTLVGEDEQASVLFTAASSWSIPPVRSENLVFVIRTLTVNTQASVFSDYVTAVGDRSRHEIHDFQQQQAFARVIDSVETWSPRPLFTAYRP